METTKEIHPAMARLYKAATERLCINGVCPQSEFADWLNISPQRVNNWDKRGPSKDIRIRCQNEYGINATWVETGVGERFLSESPKKPEPTLVDNAPIPLLPKSQQDALIDEIVGFLRQTDIPGLAVILDRASEINIAGIRQQVICHDHFKPGGNHARIGPAAPGKQRNNFRHNSPRSVCIVKD